MSAQPLDRRNERCCLGGGQHGRFDEIPVAPEVQGVETRPRVLLEGSSSSYRHPRAKSGPVFRPHHLSGASRDLEPVSALGLTEQFKGYLPQGLLLHCPSI